MRKEFISTNSKQTQILGKLLAEEIRGQAVICLEGDLGAGKTTFTQGFLQGLKIKGPYTSPTFVVMKHYERKVKSPVSTGRQEKSKVKIFNIYHIDAYRVNSEDVLNLGWEEIIAGENIIIIEWADRIKKIIPKDAVWIKFEWLEDKKRKIIIK